MIRKVMWKFLSRGFRETFERGANISRNADARVKTEAHNNRACCWTWRSTPLAVKKCPFTNVKENCSGKRDRNEGPRERKERTSAHNYFDDWFGAFSYSSGLVLGWVLTQPYSHWRKWYQNGNQQKFPKVIPGSLVPFLARVAISQPLNVIHAKDSSPVLVNNDAIEPPITFGPITADQALEEAAEELRSVHNSVVGEVENRTAVALIEKGENFKAVALLRAASERGYAPASYNLGHCYENGIGTKQDFAKAAQWYKKAADMGHATAMYNLGVFYAHGWGGLVADSDKARKLLTQAASMGQPDARAALGMDRPSTPPPNIAQETLDWGFSEETSPNKDFGTDPNELYNMGISFENSFEENSSDPHLILQMYQLASELGHSDAKSRLDVLKAYDAIGLLSEFLLQKEKKPWSLKRNIDIEGARSVP